MSKVSRLFKLKKRSTTTGKKDTWDKLSSISTFLSTVILTMVGLYISESFKEKQSIRNAEIKKIEVLEKFMPHLSSGDNIKVRTSLLAIQSLGLDSLAIQLAKMVDNDSIYGGTEALVEMYNNVADTTNQKTIKEILLKKGESGNANEKKIVHKEFKGYYWVIDNGHGLNSPERKKSPEYEPNKFLYEGDFNRKIANKLIKKLTQNKIPHYKLVPEETDIKISERVNRINNLKADKPKIVISIHANYSGIGSPWSQVEGVEIFYGRQNISSEKLAEVFLKNIITETGAKRRSIKPANFDILNPRGDIEIPAILIESGFLDNEEELQNLLSDGYQNEIVAGIYNAIALVEEKGIGHWSEQPSGIASTD